jgi:hypothetical protein
MKVLLLLLLLLSSCSPDATEIKPGVDCWYVVPGHALQCRELVYENLTVKSDFGLVRGSVYKLKECGEGGKQEIINAVNIVRICR